MEKNDKIKTHKQFKHFAEAVIVPEHEKREESPEFRQAKKRLKEDGHFQCWVCGCKENLEVHHFAGEWCLENIIDFDKLKRFCEEWDPYGYGNLLKNKQINSVDDIRNLLVLCEKHHIGVDHNDGDIGTGIHTMTFPTFVIQKLAKDNIQPIPNEHKDNEK